MFGSKSAACTVCFQPGQVHCLLCIQQWGGEQLSAITFCGPECFRSHWSVRHDIRVAPMPTITRCGAQRRTGAPGTGG